ncbi:acyl-CoA thioesterase [Methylobacterium dankookense]|uniref:1,4-dihydroxy-2-naphthoyl-CoA hydrolase n=1 Tax=Methylobacterium dankookense TaxID=560405 RepID=A0A564G717_9HYPH|nr:thioesterase family protein [Methylobacterium dankookense]GJD59457.1 1,4-dihydroxy-2-naphthoyl-CoA hydrolase [Methylobacterium dankookense]VUF15804.1 1,4-dihydroxy-2-naphthoyl-CoA hydrolase [Methylobacterium dankookense]
MSTALPRSGPPARAAQAGLFHALVRVRFSHCDPAGIVYFPRWFDLMNGVVEDGFGEALGLDYRGFHQARGIGLGYAHAEADYVSPGFWDDRLHVFVRIERIGGGSLALALTAYRGEAPVFAACLVIVTTSLETRCAIPLPDDLRATAERYRAAQPHPPGTGDLR